MSAPKHDWAVGDRAEVIGHQTQAQGVVVSLRKTRYVIGVQFPGIDYTYWYAPGQLKFLGPAVLVKDEAPSQDLTELGIEVADDLIYSNEVLTEVGAPYFAYQLIDGVIHATHYNVEGQEPKTYRVEVKLTEVPA